MKNNINKFLPIGSIVKVKDQELVIVGYRISHPEFEKRYDYMGYPYPYGFIDTNTNIIFDFEEIESIVFEGFKDEQYKEMLYNIEKNIQKEDK